MSMSNQMTEPFHQTLLAEAAPLWEKMLGHPFLSAVADGSIADETFKAWVVQDYLFIREALSFLSILHAKAPHHLRPTLGQTIVGIHQELDLFRKQAEAHGISFEGATMSFVCQAYAHFLKATAYERSFEEVFTVIYGTEKTYLDCWLRVKQEQAAPSRWQAFIDNWTSEAFQGFVTWLATTLDEIAAHKSPHDLEAMRDLFLMTVRYEYMFWEMVYTDTGWPV